MINRFRQVDKDVFRGSAPNIEDVILLNKKIGIKKIISLDARAGHHIDRACKLLGIQHFIIPIDGISKKTIINFLNHDIEELLLNDGPSFIHCHYGKDRTGLAVALFRCKHDGWTAEEAIKEAHSLGFGVGIDPKVKALYMSIIRASCKNKTKNLPQDINNASDIVDNVHDLQQLQYTDYVLEDGGERSSLSYGPFNDYRVKKYPDNDPILEYNEQYKARNNQEPQDISNLLEMHVSKNTIPTSGSYDQNTSGISGAGPSMIGDGIIT
jgi:hypothetical protein